MKSFTRSRLSVVVSGFIGFVALALAGSAVRAATPAVNSTAQVSTPAVPRRGDVITRGRSVKAVTQGPVVIRAYSEFAGGAVFTAAATTGTDKDCELAANARTAAQTQLAADRLTPYSARAGEVICLVTDTTRSFELLWRSVEQSSREERLALGTRK